MRAVVIGSGPNGLAGAIALAQAGLDVEVHEAEPELGGGMRSAELTLPGFVHDVCSSIHPLGLGSPFFSELELDVEWIQPDAPAAHPFDDGSALLLERDLDATASALGRDGASYRRLVAPLVGAWRELERLPLSARSVLGLRCRLGSRGLLAAARSSLSAARTLAESRFAEERTRSWFAGHSAHSMLPLERRPSAGFGLALVTLGHTVGWPFPRGGSQRLADALRGRLPERYRRRLLAYRHGPGAFKVDWALDGPIPWRAAECLRGGTVHLGATLEEIAASEWGAWSSRPAGKPFVLLAQTSLFDETRAPPGKHTAWAYCHVPNGSSVDMAERIEAQVERFAPGFRDLILARHTMGPAKLEAHDRNLVGGDLNGGAMDLGQLFFRPVRKLVPYRTPLRGVYLCSSSTPPGGGVHGMCGFSAARVALRDLR